jgi:hypothetical protein
MEVTPELYDHPSYYGGKDNPYECIKVLEAWLSPLEFFGWLRGTIIKYQSRTAKKQSHLDNEKCAWYSRYLAEWLKRTGFDPLAAIQRASGVAALLPAVALVGAPPQSSEPADKPAEPGDSRECRTCNKTGKEPTDSRRCRTCGGCGVVPVVSGSCPFCSVQFRGVDAACRVCARPLYGVDFQPDHGFGEHQDPPTVTMLNQYLVGAHRDPSSPAGDLAGFVSVMPVPEAPGGHEWVFILIDSDPARLHFIGWPFPEGEAEEAFARLGRWAGYEGALYFRRGDGIIVEWQLIY